MIALIRWILGFALSLGFGAALVEHTYRMADAAIHAHKYDQMSYSIFTRAMTEGKPRQKTNQSSK